MDTSFIDKARVRSEEIRQNATHDQNKEDPVLSDDMRRFLFNDMSNEEAKRFFLKLIRTGEITHVSCLGMSPDFFGCNENDENGGNNTDGTS